MKVITTNPMSIESLKASISKAADEGDATLQKEGITEKKKEEVIKEGVASYRPGVQREGMNSYYYNMDNYSIFSPSVCFCLFSHLRLREKVRQQLHLLPQRSQSQKVTHRSLL